MSGLAPSSRESYRKELRRGQAEVPYAAWPRVDSNVSCLEGSSG